MKWDEESFFLFLTSRRLAARPVPRCRAAERAPSRPLRLLVPLPLAGPGSPGHRGELGRWRKGTSQPRRPSVCPQRQWPCGNSASPGRATEVGLSSSVTPSTRRPGRSGLRGRSSPGPRPPSPRLPPHLCGRVPSADPLLRRIFSLSQVQP